MQIRVNAVTQQKCDGLFLSRSAGTSGASSGWVPLAIQTVLSAPTRRPRPSSLRSLSALDVLPSRD